MNERFYSLPEEKQNEIINAAYEVFSGHSYKKSAVGKIAEEAGISKSLLFYYFRDKKDLYLFLWNKAAEFTGKVLEDANLMELPFFDLMEQGLKIKMDLLRKYPHLGEFTIDKPESP